MPVKLLLDAAGDVIEGIVDALSSSDSVGPGREERKSFSASCRRTSQDLSDADYDDDDDLGYEACISSSTSGGEINDRVAEPVKAVPTGGLVRKPETAFLGFDTCRTDFRVQYVDDFRSDIR